MKNSLMFVSASLLVAQAYLILFFDYLKIFSDYIGLYPDERNAIKVALVYMAYVVITPGAVFVCFINYWLILRRVFLPEKYIWWKFGDFLRLLIVKYGGRGELFCRGEFAVLLILFLSAIGLSYVVAMFVDKEGCDVVLGGDVCGNPYMKAIVLAYYFAHAPVLLLIVNRVMNVKSLYGSYMRAVELAKERNENLKAAENIFILSLLLFLFFSAGMGGVQSDVIASKGNVEMVAGSALASVIWWSAAWWFGSVLLKNLVFFFYSRLR